MIQAGAGVNNDYQNAHWAKYEAYSGNKLKIRIRRSYNESNVPVNIYIRAIIK